MIQILAVTKEETKLDFDKVVPTPEEKKIEQTAIKQAKTPNFTEEDFENADLMKYEKANKLALGYYGMNRNSKKLMTAALVLAWNINKMVKLTESELEEGFWVGAPIAHVGKLMGYDIKPGEMKKSRYVYQAINDSIDGVFDAKIKSVDEKNMSIEEFVLIDRILYNPDETGRCYFHINGGTCKYVINNGGSFTVYSLILNNYLDKNGTAVAADLYEILKTQLYLAEKNALGQTKLYMDYIDLRAKLNLINVNDPRVDDMLHDKRFANYDKDEEVAYRRLLELERFDENIDKVHQGNKLKVSSYNKYKHFRERVLAPTQEAFLNCYRNYPDLMPFMFDFEPKKYKGKTIGILFTVYTIDAFRQKLAAEGRQMTIFDLPSEIRLLESRQEIAETFESAGSTYKASNEEVKKIMDSDAKRKTDAANKAKAVHKKEVRDPAIEEREPFLKTLNALDEYFSSCNEDFDYQDMFSLAMLGTSDDIKEKHQLMKQASNVYNKVGWLVKALKEDWKEPKKQKKKAEKGSFNDFSQNDYDFAKLEKMLLANGAVNNEGGNK